MQSLKKILFQVFNQLKVDESNLCWIIISNSSFEKEIDVGLKTTTTKQ